MVVELKVLVNFCCLVIGCPLCILPLSRGPHKQCAVGALEGGVRGGLLRGFAVLLCEHIPPEGLVPFRVLLVSGAVRRLLLRAQG